VTTYLVEQRIRYDYTAPARNLRQRLMVVPPETHGCQRRLSWTLTVDGPEEFRSRSGRDAFGNHTLEVVAPRVLEWVEFSVTTEVGISDPVVHHVAPSRRYVSSTRLTAPDERVARLVGSGGAAPDPAAICSRVHAALGYEYGVTGVQTTATEALAAGRGVCQDYAHVMLAVCRLAGLPASYASGHLVGEGGSHAWVEVLRPDRDGKAWIVEGWDPTHDRMTGLGYVTIAVGRDYGDVAPVSGTYDGRGVVGTLHITKRVAAGVA